ncbi:MAG: Mu transposase C-terminal domain-containing protein [Solirubrobacteraceae bacterium]
MSVTCLTVGSRVSYDGGVWTVLALAGDVVTVQEQGSGRALSLGACSLLGAPDGAVLGGGVIGPVGGVGAQLASLTAAEMAVVCERAGHVREVLTGYRSGGAQDAVEGEPRAEYRPGVPLMDRYRAKTQELGIGERTLRRWARAFELDGEAGLIDARHQRPSEPLGNVDSRWLDVLRAVLDEHVGASRPTQELLLDRVDARAAQEHGAEAVPKRWKAKRAVRELARGTNALKGSTKSKRSIANRPDAPYGRLVATRPGEYLLLDTTTLDVFAMDALALRWVGLELTIAVDLFSRCVVALRLSPVSTKAVDVSLVLFEAICPDSKARTGSGLLPYAGVPSGVIVADEGRPAVGLPGVAPETLVIDNGKIYISAHLRSVCARLGVSIQPARPFQPTDKAVVERIFRTIGEDLLAALPGYKGPDVYGRGEHPELEIYYFVDELELIIREWIAERYHRRAHAGLVVSEVPGLELSPNDAFELGVARAGRMLVPARADLVYDFLPVAWRTIQPYGVELHGLRYDGPGLNAYRNRASQFTGPHAGKWPVRFDPDDIRRVFFQDPDSNEWHTLWWEHHSEIAVPFSAETLVYARRLARQTDRFPDDRRALAELLERWDAGLTRNPTERRMALRLAQQRTDRLGAPDEEEKATVTDLASVRAVTEPAGAAGLDHLPEDGGELHGDDDDPAELDAVAGDELDGSYYDEAFGSFS